MNRLIPNNLEVVIKNYGLQQKGIQNFFGHIHNSRVVVTGATGIHKEYQDLYHTFRKSSFNNNEIKVIWQTLCKKEVCNYCAVVMGIMPTLMKVNSVLTKRRHLPNHILSKKLQVLHTTTHAMLGDRGRLSPEQTERFYAAGYTKIHMLEMILGLTQKINKQSVDKNTLAKDYISN